jgi:hypothetical protein
MLFHPLVAHFISFLYITTIISYELNIILTKVHITMVFASNFFEKLVKSADFYDFAHLFHFEAKILLDIAFFDVFSYFNRIVEIILSSFYVIFDEIGPVVYKLYHPEC